MSTRRPVVAVEKRSGLGLVQVCCGVLIGLLIGYACFDDAAPTPQADAALIPAGTSVVNVNAVVQMPTGTATAIPTVKPSPQATIDAHADDCNRTNPEPGETCRQPPMPTQTPAPIPHCPVMPGDLCVWTDPLTSARTESE